LDIEIIFVGEDDDIGLFWYGINDTFIIGSNFECLTYLGFSLESIIFLDSRNRSTKSTSNLKEGISGLYDILDGTIVLIIYIDRNSIHIDFIGNAIITFDEIGIDRQFIVSLTKLISVDYYEDKEYYKEKRCYKFDIVDTPKGNHTSKNR